MDPAVRLRQALRALLVVSTLCLGLGAALAVVVHRWRAEGGEAAGPARNLLDDPELRRAAIAEIVAKEGGGWDTFPDPEVGRLLQPGIETKRMENDKFTISSNDLGLRERPIAMPKPAGTTRVVLLGDSFVFGEGVNANDRFGAFLEGYLAKNATGAKQKIECLHVGMTCWNVVSETAFLKRMLSLLQPDLVIHLIIRNDLEDNPGARGFGRLANFDPLHGERGEPTFQARFSAVFGKQRLNWLSNALDWESRSRFEDAGRRIAQLADLVTRAGGRYLMVDYYVVQLPKSKRYLTPHLKPEQVCYLPTELARKDGIRVDEYHWNRIGHEIVAKALYSAIRERGLLPQLALADWPEATAVGHEWLGKGEAEAAGELGDTIPARRKIRSAIDFTDLDDEGAAQVTGGVVAGGAVAGGLAGPYAALILASGGAKRVRVRGHGLARVELDGVKVDVFVEETKVGSFTVNGGERIDCDFAIPAEVAARTYVSVRFVASDFAYSAGNLRQHVVFALEKLELAGG